MNEDPLAHHARLRRPTALIGGIAALHLLATLPLAVINLDQSWRHPLEGLTGWMVLWLVLGVPITAVASVLAARLDRALSGVRHRQRAVWAGVALGAILAAHFATHMLWTPAYFFWALTSSYRTEENLVGAFAALLAWGFVGFGLWIARKNHRRLQERTWEDESADERPRRFPRIPSPWLGAIAYGLVLLPISLAFGVFAVDEAPILAFVLWSVIGAPFVVIGAGWGAWLYEGVPHGREPTRAMPRFVELLGTAWCAHWTGFLAVALMPFWNDWHHDDQLVASVLAAFAITAGTAAWSYGRAARWVPAG